VVSTATIQDLQQNSIYSLNGKDYNQTEIVCGDDYELVEMKDLCDFEKYKSEKPNNGLYNHYSCSNNIKCCSNGNITGEYILMGTRGTIANAIHYYSGRFGCGDNMLLFNSTKISNKYIYIILIIMKPIIHNMITGSTIPMISSKQIQNLKIPVPNNPKKIQHWVDKISQPYNEKNEKQTRIQELEKTIQERIHSICDNEDCEEVELGSVCEINPETFKNQFNEINYVDIGSVNGEKIHNIQNITKSFPSRAKRIINKFDILYSTVRPNLKGYTFINNDIFNGVASSGFAVIRCQKINPKYIYTLLKREEVTSYLMSNSTGTTYPAVNPSVFKKIKIKLPKNKKLVDDLNPMFQEIETLQSEVKIAEELYKKYIQELGDEAMPNGAEGV
jgi:type I restriction enzyme, S subunit